MRDLLSTYGFRGGVEPMVGLAEQWRGLGGPSPLTIVLTVVAGCWLLPPPSAHLSNQLFAAADPFQSVAPADASTRDHYA